MDLAQKPVYKLDLAAGTSVVNLTTPLVEGDDRAQTFTLEFTDKGAPANLNGYSVTAYFGRGKTAEAEADTIPVSGTVSGNVAKITLTESCYSRSCYFSMPIRLSNGATGQKRTYLIVRGTVVKSVDGRIIDPDGSVPSLDDLFAQIAVMERSRQAAEEATEEALVAASRADEAREGIQGDLATLTEEIDRETAPPIIPTATGEVVTVSDSANRPLAGLRLYGKTTQDGVPTPDAPVPMVNVGAGGSIGVKATGKNLFCGISSDNVYSGVTIKGGCGAVITAYGTAMSAMSMLVLNQVLPAGTYTIKLGKVAAEIARFEFTVNDTTVYLFSEGSYIFELPATSTIKMNAIIYEGANFGTSDNPTKVSAQIEAGSTATSFEPYADGGSMTASTPNGLPGIPVTSGGNYTDENGQMWLCDEKDYERGEYVENMLTITLNGSNYPFIASSNNAFSAELPLGYDAAYGDYRAISSHLTFDGYIINTNAMGRDDAFAIYRHPDAVVGACSVFIRMTRFTTADELNTWLASNPVTIMYPRRKPIVTPLSADELTAYRAMTSQYPNTTVYNDSGAGMAVDYIADTKNYIDQRIAALLNA